MTSAKIRDGQVLAPDLGAGAVGGSALAPGAVGGIALAPGAVGAGALAANSVGAQHVQDNSLGGADIDESSLSGVNAQTLGGASLCSRLLRLTPDAKGPTTVEQDLCQIGPFTISSTCEAAADPGESITAFLQVETTENDSFFSSTADTKEWARQPDLDSGSAVEFFRHNEFEEGDGPSVSETISFQGAAPSGGAISGQVTIRADSLVGTARICDFAISAIG